MKATTNPTPSCLPLGRSGRAQLFGLLGEDGLLVVEGLVPARPEHRLAQPRHAEDQEQRPDDDAQCIEGYVADERDADHADHHGQHDDGSSSAFESRPPTSGHTGGHDDGEGLDHLDQAGPEHCHQEECG